MKHPDGQPADDSSALGGGAPLLTNGLSGDLEMGVARMSSSTLKSGGPLLADGLSGELELGVTWMSSSTAKSGDPRVRDSTTATVDVIIRRIYPGARNVDPGEYDPHHVSIGPYHHRRPQGEHLSKEHDKQVGLAAVLSEAPSGSTAAEASCIHALTCLEGRAKGCYGEDIDMDSGEFVRMLLTDGCYLLACFGSVYCSAAGLTADTLAVVRDVFYLAENQIPFFVLEKIAELTASSDTTALDDIRQYAIDLLKIRRYSMAEPMPTAPGNLLHLLRMHLNPTELAPTSGGGGEKVTRWRTATDYYLAGVNIESRAISGGGGSTRCILDVKLSGGTLAIPCLDIDGQTWRLLRNLMALEQHNRRSTVASHVTAYCVFMSQLACEAADVELLGRRKVIVHSHGNDGEVAKCFADLCKGINFDIDDPDANYLRTTWQEVEERCRSRRSRWLAWLRRKYFSNPWVTIGLIAGAVGLTCTIIEAVYSVLSYRKGPK